ncbi:MAG: hypothetical protein GY854_13845 [Deltaproteobacteria bacterium]|nr:hypothetical protein [Deltaproteobacteria bacterium]
MVLRALLIVATFCTLACACVESENSAGDNRPKHHSKSILGDSFLPSHAEEQLRKTHILETELAHTIDRLDGVAEARVHLQLADRSLLSRDRNAPSQAAIVVKRTGKSSPEESTLRELAAAAIPDLKPGSVQVFFSGVSEPPMSTEYVGPIEVAASSARTARLCLGAMLGLVLVLALGLVAAGLKLRRLRQKR